MSNLPQSNDTFYIEHDIQKLDLPKYIDRPEYVENKLAGYSLQALGWMLWLWMLLPLLTLLLWIYQGAVIQTHILSTEAENQLHHFRWVAIIILLLMLGLIVWASYNWYRFYNVENRKPIPEIGTQELSSFFIVNAKQLEEMQSAKVLVIHYDKNGKFVIAETTEYWSVILKI